MAITVQTNIGALSASRNLNINQNALNNSIERLSSGFRINRAADDAAGFAIAAKLTGQNARLQAASSNALQATSLVQQADASANAIQDMLTRLQTLATQAASAQNSSELGKLDKERSLLEAQIDRIANSANFNGVNLLNGLDSQSAATTGVAGTTATLSAGGSGITAASTTKVFENAKFTLITTAGTAQADGSLSNGGTIAGGSTDGISFALTGNTSGVNGNLFVSITVDGGTGASTVTIGTAAGGSTLFSGTIAGTGATAITLSNGVKLTATDNGTGAISGSTATLSISGAAAAASGQVTSVKSDKDLTDSAGAVIVAAGGELLLGGTAVNRNSGTAAGNTALTLVASSGGQSATVTLTDAAQGSGQAASTTATVTVGGATTGAAKGQGAYTAALDFQVGADNNSNNRVSVDLTKKFTGAGLGISGDILTQSKAQTYIDTIKAALDNLATKRATLGSTQNQIGFVNDSLATSIEQVSSAISTIKDANLATETASFAKNQILVQAGTSMLAQANTAAQNVLRLFQ